MQTYLILQHPGHNRVYYNAAGSMALAELEISLKRLSISCSNCELVNIAGVRYISFAADVLLPESDLEIVGRLSFVFAVYLLNKNSGAETLMPVKLPEYEYMDQKISSILKYPGKTNELFTKMMVNIGLLSGNYSYSDAIKLLDPVAGRVTTL